MTLESSIDEPVTKVQLPRIVIFNLTFSMCFMSKWKQWKKHNWIISWQLNTYKCHSVWGIKWWIHVKIETMHYNAITCSRLLCIECFGRCKLHGALLFRSSFILSSVILIDEAVFIVQIVPINILGDCN